MFQSLCMTNELFTIEVPWHRQAKMSLCIVEQYLHTSSGSCSFFRDLWNCVAAGREYLMDSSTERDGHAGLPVRIPRTSKLPQSSRLVQRHWAKVKKREERRPKPFMGMMDDHTGEYEKPISPWQILEQNKVDPSWINSWIPWSPDVCKETFYDTLWDIETCQFGLLRWFNISACAVH